jgi:hypothetical protein
MKKDILGSRYHKVCQSVGTNNLWEWFIIPRNGEGREFESSPEEMSPSCIRRR